VRESDVVGRLGGDEFAVILVQADEDTAVAKAETLKSAIESVPADLGQWSAPLKVSYGVRAIEPGAEPEAVLAEADAQMFVRKRKG
jgi:diguanylate cyclase (GGDEF)-like protein